MIHDKIRVLLTKTVIDLSKLLMLLVWVARYIYIDGKFGGELIMNQDHAHFPFKRTSVLVHMYVCTYVEKAGVWPGDWDEAIIL